MTVQTRNETRAYLGMSARFDGVAALDAAHEGICITTTDIDRPGPTIVYVNPAFEAMTGWALEEVIGRNPRFLQGPETDLAQLHKMREPLSRGEAWTGSATNYRKDGTPFVMEWSISPILGPNGRATHFIAVQKDVTERVKAEKTLIDALKAAQEADRAKIDFLAMMNHQLRTPLNAILGYSDMMKAEILGPFKDSPYASYADAIHESGQDLLDQVEHILTYAHDGENHALEEDWVDLTGCVAESLSSLGRLVRQRNITVEIDAESRVLIYGDAARLQRMIRNIAGNAIQYAKAGGTVVVRVREDDGILLEIEDDGPGMSEAQLRSVTGAFERGGITALESGAGTGLGLAIAKRTADLHGAAFAITSNMGASGVGTGTRVVIRFPERRASLLGRLKRAMREDQFILHYQPKVRLSDGKLAGVEALLRWNDPGRGMIPPATFLGEAEDGGMIMDVSDWVMNAACRQIAAWGEKAPRIAINLSAVDFEDPQLPDRVSRALLAHGVSSDRLELEITESRFMQKPENAIANMDALRTLGVTVAIDDFGTGYSSLAYIKDLNIQCVKLDRSFVQTSTPGDRGFEVVQATLALAHALNLKVVAEGIETPEQRDALVAQGCAEGQGFLFSRPVPAADLDLDPDRRYM